MNLVYMKDDKMQVSFIQSYLKDNFTNYLLLNGVYDLNTHRTLKSYLSSETYSEIPTQIGKTLVNWYDESNIYKGYKIDKKSGIIVQDVQGEYLMSLSEIHSELDLSIIHENYNNTVTIGLLSIDPNTNHQGLRGQVVQDIQDISFSQDQIQSDYTGRSTVISLGTICNYVELTPSESNYNPDYNNYLVIQFKSSVSINEENQKRVPSDQLTFSRSFMVIPGKLYVTSPWTGERVSNIQLDHIIQSYPLLSVSNILKLDEYKHWGFNLDNLTTQSYYAPPYKLYDETYWSVSDYLMSYLTYTSITEKSNKESIVYYQYLVSLLEPDYVVLSGEFNAAFPFDFYKDTIRKFQIESKLSSSGRIDPVTEKSIRDRYLVYNIDNSEVMNNGLSV